MANVVIFGKVKPSLSLVVITAEGKRYNLGSQRDGRLAWLYKLNQDLRIKYYIWHRRKQLKEK